MLAVSMRPYIVVYIPHQLKNTDVVCDVIHSATISLQTDAPFLSLETVIMPLHSPLSPHLRNMFHALPDTIKYWSYFMPTPSKHITHYPNLSWEEQITTMRTSNLCRILVPQHYVILEGP